MIDKELMKLLGGGKKYIGYTVCSMVLGLCANLGITMCICRAIRIHWKTVIRGSIGVWQ